MQNLKSALYKGPREINPHVKFRELLPLEEVTHFEKNINVVNGNSFSSSSSSASPSFASTSSSISAIKPNPTKSTFSTIFGKEKHQNFVISCDDDEGGVEGESDSDNDNAVWNPYHDDRRNGNYKKRQEQQQSLSRAQYEHEQDEDCDILDVGVNDVKQKGEKNQRFIHHHGDLGENNLNLDSHYQHENELHHHHQNSSSSSNNNSFLSLNESFVVDVKIGDVILDAIVFIFIVGEFFTTCTLAVLHYQDDSPWACTLTLILFLLGSFCVLHQFNLLQQDQMQRLFDKGKRIRIAVNCFPPLGTIISSFQCVKVGQSALRDGMLSSKYLEIENFSKHLLKIQSFFQSAPQATLQLILFIEAVDSNSIGFAKGFISLSCIVISLSLMTNGSLPSKAENSEHLKKTTQSFYKRLFVGIRMSSNFASRCMAVSSLFVSSRCVFGPEGAFIAVVMSMGILLVPRVIFTFVDFLRQVITTRRLNANDVIGTSNENPNLNPNQNHQLIRGVTFMGYLATVFFPVCYPVSIFWYTWAESAVFVLVGNFIGWYRSCLINLVNFFYTLTFLTLFIIVPVCIPYAHNQVKQRNQRRRILEHNNFSNQDNNDPNIQETEVDSNV